MEEGRTKAMIYGYIQKWKKEDRPWQELLKDTLKKYHQMENCPEIFKDAMGKPYLQGSPICFNVSHSGDYLVLAISKNPVGVDIQKIKAVRSGMYEKIVRPIERSLIGEERERDFIRLWTLKESFGKAEGKGLRIPMKDYYLTKEKEEYFVVWGGQKQPWTFNIEETLLKDYVVSVCGMEQEVLWRVEQE